MKKKRFYNNKKRNQKWTEPETGRKIDFADKYIEGSSSDKFDAKRPKQKGYTAAGRSLAETRLKRLLILLCCVVLIATGYTGMDAYIQRHAEPAKHIGETTQAAGERSAQTVRFAALMTEGISLDSSIMLSAVMNTAQQNGFTALAFEAKRPDGTVSYTSSLASVDTFSAMSSAGAKPKQSVKAMLADDLLPVAVISCYQDNVLPAQVSSAAVMNGKKPYRDSDGNTYLNPDSEFTYNYIKDIITELQSFGVTVFVLQHTDLPEEISDKYGDGFAALSKKLYRDVPGNLKLLQVQNVSVSAQKMKAQVGALKPVDSHSVYAVKTTVPHKKIITALLEQSVSTFIIKG